MLVRQVRYEWKNITIICGTVEYITHTNIVIAYITSIYVSILATKSGLAASAVTVKTAVP